MAFEVNFDGLVGPTHNYSGLSFGNLASVRHQLETSNPREAALQGLEKMRYLTRLGLKQAVLPPHERPHISSLRAIGFSGSDEQVLGHATKFPGLLNAVSSASAMWTANAATVVPSPDSEDGKTHFVAANLSSKFHRSIEAPVTCRILKAIFSNEKYFGHHQPLPPAEIFADEGAANHNRLCTAYDKIGLHLFTYGRKAMGAMEKSPILFPARQTLEASEAVARCTALRPNLGFFVQQNPRAIDSGVFHSDVIAVGNQNLLFLHEEAFFNQAKCLSLLSEAYKKVTRETLNIVEVKSLQVPLEEAVRTYLFNSQLISVGEETHLLAPADCRESDLVRTYLEGHVGRSKFPIQKVHYLNVRQSMNNGGGPACLRLRVVLNDEEIKSVQPRVFLDEALYGELSEWVKKYYRDRLTSKDLADPALLRESREALQALTQILKLGNIYDFQNPH